ncbi:MAG: hypothetical protein ACREMY_24235 [bacterium]
MTTETSQRPEASAKPGGRTGALLGALARHWVALLDYALVVLCWRSGALGAAGPSLQAVYLFLVCLLLPILYYWTTRSHITLSVAVLRSVGLAISAITLSGWLVVDRQTSGFWAFVIVQSVGVAIVVLIEIRITIVLMGKVFRAEADKARISRESGLPEFVVGLMIKEAMFWKMVLRWLIRAASLGRR